MEYKVWQYVEEDGREFLRHSCDDKQEAIEYADFFHTENERCIVYEEYDDVKNFVYVSGGEL